MFNKNYCNFVRPASPTIRLNNIQLQSRPLTGTEAKKIYLEAVSKASNDLPILSYACNILRPETQKISSKRKHDGKHIPDKDLFLAAQNDDVAFIKDALSSCPDKISIIDDYGWSLLMIACQSNSIKTVKELLKRGVDTSVRDKAGNSAQSLVIQSKNFVLADILVTHKQNKEKQTKINVTLKTKVKQTDYFCIMCNQMDPNEQEHLSSTVHNINASKGKKIPTHYTIPQTNRGYQIMLRDGWDRDSGLGPVGAGKKYPIKVVQKKDRKGLGHKTICEETKEDMVKHRNRKVLIRDYENNKKIEIDYRREFY